MSPAKSVPTTYHGVPTLRPVEIVLMLVTLVVVYPIALSYGVSADTGRGWRIVSGTLGFAGGGFYGHCLGRMWEMQKAHRATRRAERLRRRIARLERMANS